MSWWGQKFLRLSKKIFDNCVFWEYYAIRIFIKKQRGQKLAGNNKKELRKNLKRVVAEALGVPVFMVNNDTKIGYWTLLAILFDMARLYPNCALPDIEEGLKYGSFGLFRSFLCARQK